MSKNMSIKETRIPAIITAINSMDSGLKIGAKVSPSLDLSDTIMGPHCITVVGVLLQHFGVDPDNIPPMMIEEAEARCATLRTLDAFLEHELGPFAPSARYYLALTEDQFITRYTPEQDDDGNYYVAREWDEDAEMIREAIKEGRCWTVVEDDDGDPCIVFGNRRVNRMHNIITARAVEDEDWEVEVPLSPEEKAEARGREILERIADERLVRSRVIVGVVDSEGEPTLVPFVFLCTQEQYSNGDHYSAVKQAAEGLHYESVGWSADQDTAAFGVITMDWTPFECPTTWIDITDQ